MNHPGSQSPAVRGFFEKAGWTADNRAVIHVASCGTLDGSGSPFCFATLEVFGATKQSLAVVE